MHCAAQQLQMPLVQCSRLMTCRAALHKDMESISFGCPDHYGQPKHLVIINFLNHAHEPDTDERIFSKDEWIYS
jgi:hypothetical protein